MISISFYGCTMFIFIYNRYSIVDDTMIVPPSRLEVVQRPARVAEVPGESYFVIGCDDFSLEHPFQCPTLSYPAGFMFIYIIYIINQLKI